MHMPIDYNGDPDSANQASNGVVATNRGSFRTRPNLGHIIFGDPMAQTQLAARGIETYDFGQTFEKTRLDH